MWTTSIEPFVRHFFGWYGRAVYKWRWPLFVVPLIITPILSSGFFRLNTLKVDDPSYVFTPRDARWRYELSTFSSIWPLDENKFLPGKSFESKRFVSILVRAKDDGDILRSSVLNEIQALNDWVMYNISTPTIDQKFNLTYQDLCLSYDWVCGGNEHILMFKERFRVGKFINLSFPRGGNQDTPVYLGTTLGGVTLNDDRTVKSANITQLFYFLKQQPDIIRYYSSRFSYAVEHFLLHRFTSDLISVSFAHYQSLEDGLDQNARDFAPNFVVSFVAVCVYAIVFSFTTRGRHKRGIDCVRSKPYVAVAGLVTTLLALCSGFGTMLLIGVPYNVINTIIPFLLIAIGVDDMFIMNACWNQSDRKRNTAYRMSEMMGHAGVAVTITNITDILSFAIGCITELPGIELFCSYAFVTLTYCYIYQLTFFAGFLAIMGDVEENQRHCLFFYKIHPTTNEKSHNDLNNKCKTKNKHTNELSRSLHAIQCDSISSDPSHQSTNSGSASSTDSGIMLDSGYYKTLHQIAVAGDALPIDNRCPQHTILQSNEKKIEFDHGFKVHKEFDNDDHRSNVGFVHYFFSDIYGPFVLRNDVRLYTLLTYLLFICVALYGCVNFKEGLNPENLVTSDHYIARFFADLKKFWVQGPQLQVCVLNPPNFTDPVQRERMMGVVRSLENTPYTLGREGTVFFFLEYLNYLDQVNAELENTDRLWNKKLRSWLKFTGGSAQWATDIKYGPDLETIMAFRFQIALKNMVEPNDHKEAAKLLRRIADNQPFHIEIYHETFSFADQYIIIAPATLRNVSISLLCMTIVALLLIPNLPSCFLILASIISINVGVFGYMTLWGVNLDAVSMISIIMSIGFAVDLSAHITYSFVTATGTSKQRVLSALKSLGWPIFQGATSTIAGISVLSTVNAYIILTFFKTVWLTMCIGMTHGLLFLPVALSCLPLELFTSNNATPKKSSTVH
ncbi:hypothetical protein AB6A40_000580 [Gnathostoma spinigerum]|uniref:SSD domain-containing protein n=1 Tax=Gnathostoma spinigerum TaxID=75299 RepID=A0ABD6E935_9BILA